MQNKAILFFLVKLSCFSVKVNAHVKVNADFLLQALKGLLWLKWCSRTLKVTCDVHIRHTFTILL